MFTGEVIGHGTVSIAEGITAGCYDVCCFLSSGLEVLFPQHLGQFNNIKAALSTINFMKI